MTSDEKEKILSMVQEERKRLEAVIEHSFDGIYITNGAADTIMVNHSYEQITGLKKEQVLGKNMKELEQSEIISVSGSLRAIKERRTITILQEFQTGKKAMITSAPVFDSEGKVEMVVTNVRDLTEIYHLKEKVEEKEQEEEKLRRSLEHEQQQLKHENMIAQDRNTLKAAALAGRVAPLDATVMLLGETGVGKEVFAKYIYQHSNRKDQSFVKVNCGAIPENLIESELFGYEKGAFTGANKNGKMGLLKLADKGTIFLDEIGELPLSMQVKLLRAIQEQEIEPVGGTKPVKIDVRIIAATNRNLEKMMAAGEFREDLYYRLMVFPIEIPPLRERKADIALLAQFFLDNFNKKYNFQKKLSKSSLYMLNDYEWPGNIRELKNIIERAVIISGEDEIEPEHLSIVDKKSSRHTSSMPKLTTDLKDYLEKLEYEYMKQAYEEYGNVRDAAKSLGMNFSTFVRKRKKMEH